MSTLRSFHDSHGGEYVKREGRPVVAHYGRPERTHLAVRNGVGVMEQSYDVLVVTGDDRIEYVDNVVSNAIPATPGSGAYCLLLDPSGRIRFDLYVYTAADRLLLFLPPGRVDDIVEEWRERVFIQDVSFEVATADYALLTVTGPTAIEKLTSILDIDVPETTFTFEQATIADAGVTVIATEGLTGEASYDIVCAQYDAEVVMDALVNLGPNAVPFGYRTWETLTIEAGTPLLESELSGELPNVVGIRNGLDFEKGCFVGQEVVSRIENRGQPNERLVGLTLEALPEAGDTVLVDGEEAGRVTRAAQSPSRETPIALAFLPYDYTDAPMTVDGSTASVSALPFVEGSARSDRLPTYRS